MTFEEVAEFIAKANQGATLTISANKLNHKHQSFTSSRPPVERNLLKQHFPKLEDLVISYIKELPKYRLHFATNDIGLKILDKKTILKKERML